MVSITNINQPSFQLPQLLEGETAALFVDDARVPSVYDPDAGTLTPLGAIPDGEHRISFALLDREGSETVRSPELVVRIKAVPPATPAEALRIRGELSVLNGIQVTAEARPDFVIENPADGETPRLYANGQPLAASWSPSDRTLVPLQVLGDGIHQFHYTVLDVAGNESAASPGLSLRIMADPVEAPASAPTLLAPASAAAIAGHDPVEAQSCGEAPSFTICLPADGQTPSLLIDGARVLASWYPASATLTPLTPLALGLRRISYTLRNAVGRVSEASPTLLVMVSPEPVLAATGQGRDAGQKATADGLVGVECTDEAAVDMGASIANAQPESGAPGLGGVLEAPLAEGDTLFAIVEGTWIKARVSGLDWTIEVADPWRLRGRLTLIRQSAAGELGDCVTLPESAIRAFGTPAGSGVMTPGNDEASGTVERDAANTASVPAATASPRPERSSTMPRVRRGARSGAADAANSEMTTGSGSASGVALSACLATRVRETDQIYLVSRGQWIAVRRSGSVWTAFDPGGRTGDWSYRLVCVNDSGQLDALPGVAEADAHAAWIATRPAPADSQGVLGFIVEASSAASESLQLSLQIEPLDPALTLGLQVRSGGAWEGWRPGMRLVLPPGQTSMRVELRVDDISASRLPPDLSLIAVPAGSLAAEPPEADAAVPACDDGGRDIDSRDLALARV